MPGEAGTCFLDSLMCFRSSAPFHASLNIIISYVVFSPLSRWEPGGDLAENAIRRTKAALEALPTGSHLAGMLWHQGESDCQEADSQFSERLQTALSALREKLDEPSLPIVVGEMGHFLAALAKDDKRFAYATDINASIFAASKALVNCECASAQGLGHGGDRLHFDTPSLMELGRRYAAKWVSLRCKRDDETNFAVGGWSAGGEDIFSTFSAASDGKNVEKISCTPSFTPAVLD